jgi:hypothetical protein
VGKAGRGGLVVAVMKVDEGRSESKMLPERASPIVKNSREYK